MRIIILLFVLGIASPPPQENCKFPDRFDRKISRFLKKECGKSIQTIRCLTPDMDHSFPDRYIYYLNDALKSILVISKVKGCHIGGCGSGIGEESSRYEHFWYATIYNQSGYIQSVKVLDFPSEYGYEITSKYWLRQFEAKKGCELEYASKEVDAISGATVSAQAIVSDLNYVCWLFSDFPK